MREHSALVPLIINVMFKDKEVIDKILLANGFKYYDDWKYGPSDTWSEDYDIVTLKLMHHDLGYWLIFSRHASGENASMNIGESNNAEEIIKLRDILKKVASGNITKKST